MFNFRNQIILVLIGVVCLPVLLVSFPLLNKINHITRAAAINELVLSTESHLKDLRYSLSFLNKDLRQLSQQRDIKQAITSTLFSYRAKQLLENLKSSNPLVENAYLLDNTQEPIEWLTGQLDYTSAIQVAKDALQQLGTKIKTNELQYTVFNSQPLLSLPSPSDKITNSAHGIAISMAVFSLDFSDQKSQRIGTLLIIVPMNSLFQQFSNTLSLHQFASFIQHDASLISRLDRPTHTELITRVFPLSLPELQDPVFDIEVSESRQTRLHKADKTNNRLQNWLIAILSFLLVLIVLVANYLARPVRKLNQIVNHYHQGNVNPPKVVLRYREFIEINKLIESLAHKIKQQITDLHKSNQQLSRLSRAKDHFIANTTHELRTPLYGMVGLAENLLNAHESNLTPRQQEEVKLLILTGKRLQSIINDLLDYAKLKNKQLQLSIISVDLATSLEQVLHTMQPLLTNKNLTIDNRISHDLPFAAADATRLQQILFNIIGNAIKFTPQGVITLSATHDDEFVTLSIQDTGIGIANDQLEFIFDEFTQSEEARQDHYHGTGLGLSIARLLIEQQGGSIHVESQLNQGTHVYFTLPIAPEGMGQIVQTMRQENSAIEEPLMQQWHQLQNNLVLSLSDFETEIKPVLDEEMLETHDQLDIVIVDDELLNLTLISSFLQNKQVNCHVFNKAPEAIEYIFNNKPDLVLLDVMMPNMSGFEVCIKLRQVYSTTDLPIILLSIKENAHDIAQGFKLGANDYVTKPFNKEELWQRIKMNVQMASDSQQLRHQYEQAEHSKREIAQKLAQQTEALQALQVSLTEKIQQGLNHKISHQADAIYRCIKVLNHELTQLSDPLHAMDADCIDEFVSTATQSLDVIYNNIERIQGSIQNLAKWLESESAEN